ncbi:MAG: formyltransferase family protein [Thermodesulfobacteriota bacterium]|nr:formyltransferase family protein [Thermodesulfobacteriota bacterium]
MKVIIIGYYNNIYAVETARRCHQKGIKIDAFVFQGDKLRELNERVREERTPDITEPRITDIEDLGIPCYFVKNLNNEASLSVLKRLEPDVILQGMGPIYKEGLLKIPKIGILNSHPGILPQYQGCCAVEWSLLNDDEVGSTCHFIDEGIDTGPIITSSIFKVYRGDTYQNIRTRSFYNEIDTLIEGLEMVIDGFRVQDATSQVNGKYYKVIPPEMMEIIYDKFKKGTYKHCVNR